MLTELGVVEQRQKAVPPGPRQQQRRRCSGALRRQPPDAAPLAAEVRAQRHRPPGRRLPAAGTLPAPHAAGGRGAHRRAAPRPLPLGAADDPPPPRPRGARALSLALVDLPLPRAPPPRRPPAASSQARGLPSLGAREGDGALADGRDERRQAQRWPRAQARARHRRPLTLLRLGHAL